MARAKRSVVANDKHSLRLVQQVPAGTPGAYVDPIMGASWKVSRKGLNGTSGFVSVENDPTLNDASEFTIILPPVGSDGRDNDDRFYCRSGTPDPSGLTTGLVDSFAGDEWLEVYRGTNELVATGTPINATRLLEHLTLQCRDVLHPLKKTRETSSGFWCNAPRDVFEHYSRLWQNVLADNFVDSATQFPATPGGTPAVTPNGRWQHVGTTNTAGPYLARFTPAASGTFTDRGQLLSTITWPDGGMGDHSCYRVEAKISMVAFGHSGPFLQLAVYDAAHTAFTAGMNVQLIGQLNCFTNSTGGALQYWPVNTTGLTTPYGTALLLTPPYTLAVEVRDRWVHFFLNGQLVSTGVRPVLGIGATAAPVIGSYSMVAGEHADLEYVVARKTTPPLNGGDPGDYVLPSPPAAGGLSAEYFDAGAALAQQGCAALTLAFAPGITATVNRVDAMGGTAVAAPPTFQPPSIPGPFFVRWTGAIYLPLASQDVAFQVPQAFATTDQLRLWVGQTRGGEWACSTWIEDGFTATMTSGSAVLTSVSSFVGLRVGQQVSAPGISAPIAALNPAAGTVTLGGTMLANATLVPFQVYYSIGMRSAFGSINGWYPIVCEYTWAPSGGSPGAWTGNSNPWFTYNVGGAFIPPPTSVLAPLGCYRTKANAGDSHYDLLRTLIDQIGYQWKSTPMQLESGSFPGAIVPRRRVGRDTDYVLTVDEATTPQVLLQGEDVASSVLAQAQGLGGSTTGTLTAEVFNFPAMSQHPFISQEFENIPTTTVPAQFLMHLESLLGYRAAAWEDVQAASIGQRQMQDTFPLTGVLAEFDWQPGDGLRLQIPEVGVVDTTPRQIFALKRMLYPDGMGVNQATFRPRTRDFLHTLRRFALQVYGAQRTFQGQIVESLGSLASGTGTFSQVLLPTDLSLVRQAQLIVTSKQDVSTQFQIYVNGNSIPTATLAVTYPGAYDLGPYVSRNAVTQPQMIITLVNTTPGTPCTITFQIQLRVLIPNM